jgi:hypothetical protein
MKRQKKSDIKVIRVTPEKLATVCGGKTVSVVGGVAVDCAPDFP